ncbi:MAG: hypothetical protein ACHQHN_01515 [Sphingobacteriales bacterium]
MPKNTFNGAVMGHTDVSTYYPNNANFDHFVFQQLIADPTGSDNSYSLCAYAVFTITSGLAPVLITLLEDLKGNGYKAPKGVQFANMRLYPTDLAILYPSGVNLEDITIDPVGHYTGPNGKKTDYVTYSASTPSSLQTGNTVPLDPSPPHQNYLA